MKILITSGGTNEKIDNVRYITNFSTGMLGKIIAEECYQKKEFQEIFFLTTQHSLKPKPNSKLKLIIVNETQNVEKEMHNLIKNQKIDVLIHAMAVSDYSVKKIFSWEQLVLLITNNYQDLNNDLNHNTNYLKTLIDKTEGINKDQKISSKINELILFLQPTTKIAQEIKKWDPNLYYVGFKLLDNVSTTKLIETAQEEMQKNNYQLVIANDLKNINAKKHQAYLIDTTGHQKLMNTKLEIAQEIIQTIIYDLKKGGESNEQK